MACTITAVVVVLSSFVAIANCLDESQLHNDAFIQRINEAQHSWRAGQNFHKGSYVKNLLSVLPMWEESLPQRPVKVVKNLPDSFDGRKVWNRCRSVRQVKEQGNCASAWAVVAAGVLTDRRCIANVDNVEISAQNVLSCCKACGTNCYGGYVSKALNFLGRKGAPSKACHPYEIYGCSKVNNTFNCPAVRALCPRCRVNCRKTFPKKPFQDTRRAGPAYSVANSSQVIMSEISTSGPVAAVVDVYEDFLVYKDGVYSHTVGSLLAQHPVKVVGWGTTDHGLPYWLVLNSWSMFWGDKGVVKIARGSNGINLETRVFAVDPQGSQS